ncbi:hypothetical protein AHiyo8_19500 [Arthrobacter sp. Hiyo8]|nr:hypothetical protein AHiyo8_19500 [Arthrobacter sp. Hiyo8]
MSRVVPGVQDRNIHEAEVQLVTGAQSTEVMFSAARLTRAGDATGNQSSSCAGKAAGASIPAAAM